MNTKNPYDNVSGKGRAWDKGWCAGYDDNEQTWIKQVLPIVGELEEHIRYDWENNDCLQVKKIKMIFDVFIQYAPEYDWLESLVKDAVDTYKTHEWDDLSRGDLEDLQHMAKAFGQSITKKWNVAMTYSTDIEVEAGNEDEAVEKASKKFLDDYNLYDIASESDFEGQEIH
jgi:hypothetical protein